MSDSYGTTEITSRTDWRRWLDANHRRRPGIWVVTYKKPSPLHVPYGDVVEEALCFGWVDSRPRKVNAEQSALLVTPRKPTSRWSKANKERIRRLEAGGQLTEAGIAAVEAARANGMWEALDGVEALEEPDDLRSALDGDVAARREWDQFPPSARRGILEWILSAKRPATRTTRIAETVSEAAQGRRANRWPRD